MEQNVPKWIQRMLIKMSNNSNFDHLIKDKHGDKEVKVLIILFMN